MLVKYCVRGEYIAKYPGLELSQVRGLLLFCQKLLKLLEPLPNGYFGVHNCGYGVFIRENQNICV